MQRNFTHKTFFLGMSSVFAHSAERFFSPLISFSTKLTQWDVMAACPPVFPHLCLQPLPSPRFVLYVHTQQQQLCKTCKAPEISCTRPGLVGAAWARQVQAREDLCNSRLVLPRVHTRTQRVQKREKKKKKRQSWTNDVCVNVESCVKWKLTNRSKNATIFWKHFFKVIYMFWFANDLLQK